MAEGVFRSLAKSNPRVGTIDSAGTGAYHTSDSPDPRTMTTLYKHGIRDYDHGARKVREQDLCDFDYVFAMDSSNLQNLQRIQRKVDSSGNKGKAKVMLFGEFCDKKRAEEVIDPYYGGDNGFGEVYEQVTRFSKNFLRDVIDKEVTAE